MVVAKLMDYLQPIPQYAGYNRKGILTPESNKFSGEYK